jgi:hypothetical protein
VAVRLVFGLYPSARLSFGESVGELVGVESVAPNAAYPFLSISDPVSASYT